MTASLCYLAVKPLAPTFIYIDALSECD